jgi:hypothetical protein
MKRMVVMAALVMACVPAMLQAQQDPFLGIWQLNVAKSSITRGAPPLSELMANTAEPGGFKSTLAVVSEQRTSVEIHHYIFDGRFHQTEGSDPRELSFTRIDPRHIESDTRRNGEITVKRTFELSADGRTLTVIANGKSGGGRPYSNDTRVYEKQ